MFDETTTTRGRRPRRRAGCRRLISPIAPNALTASNRADPGRTHQSVQTRTGKGENPFRHTVDLVQLAQVGDHVGIGDVDTDHARAVRPKRFGHCRPDAAPATGDHIGPIRELAHRTPRAASSSARKPFFTTVESVVTVTIRYPSATIFLAATPE